jgi:hypothetical protein
MGKLLKGFTIVGFWAMMQAKKSLAGASSAMCSTGSIKQAVNILVERYIGSGSVRSIALYGLAHELFLRLEHEKKSPFSLSRV